jgi:hypothetical protein
MDLMKKLRLNKYLKLDDLEAVKNREDRSFTFPREVLE